MTSASSAVSAFNCFDAEIAELTNIKFELNMIDAFYYMDNIQAFSAFLWMNYG